MTEIILFGLVATVGVVLVAGVLDRLLDFDDLSASTEAEMWGTKPGT